MLRRGNDLTRLRVWWIQRQGLARGSSPTSLVEALRCSGWLPTSGSTGVYIAIRARLPRSSRDAIDRAALDGVDVVEIPAAHNRPAMLVPRDEWALALRLQSAWYAKHLQPSFAKGRYSQAAFRAVAAQACRVLDEGPLTMSDIRASVTHVDAAELLTGALIDLGVRGVVRRYPADARLDSSSHLYELRHPDDRPDLDAEGDGHAVTISATRLFLRRHGPATLEEITDWSGLTRAATRNALTELNAESISVPGWAAQAWLLPEDVLKWNVFDARDARVTLLPYRDPFVSVRLPVSVLASEDGAAVLNAQQKPIPIRDVSRLLHQAIVAGGELVGVWEYDPEFQRVVTSVWRGSRALKARVAAAAVDTEHFIREQLGDARLSAVDPPDRRARRIAFCRSPHRSFQ